MGLVYRRIERLKTERIQVYLDDHSVGQIRKTAEGYRYYPNGYNRNPKLVGDAFPTLEACRLSLEEPETCQHSKKSIINGDVTCDHCHERLID